MSKDRRQAAPSRHEHSAKSPARDPRRCPEGPCLEARAAGGETCLLRLIADASSMCIAYVDGQEKYRFVNSTYGRFLDVECDGLIGTTVKDALGPRAYDELKGHISRAKAGERVAHETLVHFPDGKTRWLCAELVPHFEDGVASGFVVLADDVTERKQAELALRQSEERFKKIFNHSNDAIFLLDPEKEAILDVNPTACAMLEYEREELLAVGVAGIHPHDLPLVKAFATQVLERGSGWTAELSCRTQRGNILPAEISASQISVDGRPCMLAMVRDTSERKRAEDALRESEERARRQLAELEHIYGTAPVGLCLLDTQMRFVRINDRLAALNAVPVASHFGRTLRDIIPNIAAKAEPICRRVIDSGEPMLNVEVRAARPGRQDEDMVGLLGCHPLKSAEGAVEGVSVVVLDITERQRIEEALRESEERLASIVGSAIDAIVTIDEERRVRLFNAAAEDVFRCPAEEALGHGFARFAPAKLDNLLEGCLRAFDRSGARRRYLWTPDGLTAKRADGEEFPIEATISQSESAGQRLFTIILRDVKERERAERELRRLRQANIFLKEEAVGEMGPGDIVGSSQALQKVLESVDQVARTDATALLIGETGTGKELIARAIHERSPRAAGLLVNVNCAALPSGLIESELFGHEKGAFTGAITQKAGRFHLADGGTIFLDEIGDLPIELQAKLLRVLQEGEFERVGSATTIHVNVRVIAATNKDLDIEVAEQRFRADLYYRLNVFPIRIPPLRERVEDIPRLVRHFALKYAAKMARKINSVPSETMQALTAYSWPGNVRELQNVIERAVIISDGPELRLGEWPPAVSPSESHEDGEIPTLDELQRRHILNVLERTHWRVSGEKGAARILGLKPTTLEARMKKLGIQKRE